ncbi:MAG: DUF362 domain-containing protein [Proteobacteria bacterium]|nr:DUF362 domain-containing protein [Pseudomonadota bacterium]
MTGQFPFFYRVDQHFADTSILDVSAAVRAEFAKFNPGDRIKPGQSVAVGVPSRGMHDLKDVVVTTVECLRELGLKPYITPAMGSHGGATGEGQIGVLDGLGINESTTGVPLKGSMDVVSLGRIESGAEVFLAKDALEADHIVVINRVKPHTSFRAEVESGLCKILAVGLGRQVGASTIHKYQLGETIVPAAKLIMEKVHVLLGVAVTENALGGTNSVRLAVPEKFPEVDSELLREAWTLFPRLPIDQLDVLLVDEAGKDISGAGMDINIIGFWRRDGGERKPDYRVLALLSLTPDSHGNALGMGYADLISQRMIDSVDMQATYMNALASGALRSARVPMTLETDRRVVEVALGMVPDPMNARMARISNTLNLRTFWVTAPLLPELRQKQGVTVHEEPLALQFDEQDVLRRFSV